MEVILSLFLSWKVKVSVITYVDIVKVKSYDTQDRVTKY